MNVLFVSNLFPNCCEPARGVFNLQQIRHLSRLCPVRVIAPIAWFPIRGKFAPPAPVPLREEIGSLAVEHPRNFYLPKIGRILNPRLFAWSLSACVRRLQATQPVDVIFANWAYPDACGMARLARAWRIPFVASFSGSDLNVGLTFSLRRRQILQMVRQAYAVTVRSRALHDLLVSNGVPSVKIHVLYNGVDREMFRAQKSEISDQRTDRRPLTADRLPVLLYVGRLSREKGIADLLRALMLLRGQHGVGARLTIVGDGPQRAELRQLVTSLNLEAAVDWIGQKRPEEIVKYMNAANLLCLASHMEGVPNVALEAFACGLPIVATRVGGIPEVVTESVGILTEPKNPVALANAIQAALSRRWDCSAIRVHSTQFDWSENARQLFAILQSALAVNS